MFVKLFISEKESYFDSSPAKAAFALI